MTDAPLTILMHHRLGSQDGQAVHLLELKSAFERAGHRVVLVGPAGFGRVPFGGTAGGTARLKQAVAPWLFELMEVGYNLPALVRLVRAIRRHRPDMVYERYSLFLAAGAVARAFGVRPLLLEVNGPLYEERSAHDGLQLQGLGRLFQRLIWRRADLVLPVTAVLAGYVRSCGVPDRRIMVVPNGIDPARFADTPPAEEAKAALGLAGRTVLGFTGFLRAWNKLDLLLECVAAAPDRDRHVLVVGDGPARPELEAMAARLGVADRLTITGVVGREDIARHVAAFDIALVPGVTPYASPLKLFEYMALGKAVLSIDSANIREVLTHGETAWLVPPDGFAEGLERLAGDPALRRQLGDAGRARIAAGGFTWDRNAARIIAWYREGRAEHA
ncbi:MAG: glycosyltransferase [Alphaproteobacteria bacterium]|jgi:glycosyltransferase involved in cell wall biosynthesis|nr:glycosyltransferase [Alphaproteobacteria bacterium]